MLPCPISSLSFHLSLLSFRCRRNLSLSFVIPLILLVIPTQEESIITLCHSTYPSCHFDAGGIYYPLRLSFRRRRNLYATAIYHTLFFPIRKENLFFLVGGPS